MTIITIVRCMRDECTNTMTIDNEVEVEVNGQVLYMCSDTCAEITQYTSEEHTIDEVMVEVRPYVQWTNNNRDSFFVELTQNILRRI